MNTFTQHRPGRSLGRAAVATLATLALAACGSQGQSTPADPPVVTASPSQPASTTSASTTPSAESSATESITPESSATESSTPEPTVAESTSETTSSAAPSSESTPSTTSSSAQPTASRPPATKAKKADMFGNGTLDLGYVKVSVLSSKTTGEGEAEGLLVKVCVKTLPPGYEKGLPVSEKVWRYEAFPPKTQLRQLDGGFQPVFGSTTLQAGQCHQGYLNFSLDRIEGKQFDGANVVYESSFGDTGKWNFH